ncbi:MAG: hypothetical protein OXU69_13455 [Gemmatimonadota bacterium]|nr:hypothetical protein [Gemmatimonadota bacterium]MDE2985707.1 hypothetical protein [Gemmatimonadota bacterium]
MSTIPLRPLGFGEIVDGALQLYRRDFGLYYLIALLAAVPGYILMLVTGADATMLAADPVADAALLAEAGLVLMFTAVIAWVGTLAVAVAMAERIEERSVSVGRSYRETLRHLPSAAGATLLAFVLFGFVAAMFAFGGVAVMFSLAASGNIALTLFGTLGVFAVGAAITLFWLAATFAILPAVVIERRGVIGALQRSLSLCRGGWLRVIGIMIVASIINVAPTVAITVLFGMQDLFTSPEALGTVDAESQWLMNTANLLIAPLTAPFMVGSIMMLFHDRRVRSEAYDLETLAGTMDAR